MNLAIMTIQSINYGNRLQNYALQTVLSGLNNNVESLRRGYSFNGPLKSRLRAVKHQFGRVKHRNDSIGAFDRFDRENIIFSSSTVSKEYVSNDFSKYDLFVIGSDQVWNPDFNFNSELEYLPMVPNHKKIAYAASFGISEITVNRCRTAELLNDIPFISVREYAGAQIVKDLTGRDVPVVLDPTMLLTTSDWSKVAKKPKEINCDAPFVFKYVLGNDVNEAKIQKLADYHGLAIVDVMDESLVLGPAEFVWLAAHSELVCTDSFHASVFALLHHKPLAIFERVSSDADMSSRFDALCTSFGLVGHRSSEDIFSEGTIFETDWDDFESRLTLLREDSLNWLKNSMSKVETRG